MTDPDTAELVALNEDYVRAVQDSDVGRFEKLLAPDFYYSGPDGTLLDRAAFLEQVARPPGISGLAARDVLVRKFGDFAVIHARTEYQDAAGDARSGRYTDVWARRDGGWRAISAHVTRG